MMRMRGRFVMKTIIILANRSLSNSALDIIQNYSFADLRLEGLYNTGLRHFDCELQQLSMTQESFGIDFNCKGSNPLK